MFWSVLLFGTTVHCLAKCYLLRRYDGEICNVRSFLTSAEFSSGDAIFDAAARRQYRRKSRMLIIAVGLVLLFNQLVVWIPNEQQRVIFSIPPWIGTYFGSRLVVGLRMIYSSTFILFWAPKLAGCTSLATVLLSGLKAEQIILNHHFKHLTRGVKEFHLTSLQPMVEKVFFLTYYFALGAIGCTIFLVLSVPFSYTNFGIMASLAGFSLEILQLGHQVETLRDTFDVTAGLAFSLCAQLPYSEDQRQEYVDLRTSLSIVGLCSRNVARFGCAGIPDISVAVFAELLHTTYSVLTFLLNTV
ncbi:conserved hypothetical protein [Culex quinquefasciatus]|uniref:Odorant receptor n=1 Tax=Culex quinquefasciatus TaxID=7176 RepID=B0XLV7_CULQU|nr:conserved hypothetical protein [Culex quinquefasciatus]|eukprot:XP_001870628.1 conserved hypothetical protein [Culex quinquefasciatus]